MAKVRYFNPETSQWEYMDAADADTLQGKNAKHFEDYVDDKIGILTDDVSALETDKVDKVAGKGLSTEDYTTAEKDKLGNIESEANKTLYSSATDSELEDRAATPKAVKVVGDDLIAHKAERATQSELGHVKVDGRTIFIDEEGVISVSNPYPDDLSGSPGNNFLIAGSMDAGYFGTVPASELWTGSQLSSEVGISQGTIQFNDTPWLKFALDGKILFRPMKSFRNAISWDTINSAGCVFGTKTVTKNGLTYKVRLMRGALTDPSKNTDPDRGAKGSEWNRLMLPIHIQAKDKSWSLPENVEADTPYWGIDFTNEDLQGLAWCQETAETLSTQRVMRGGNNGPSSLILYSSSAVQAVRTWAPVLELVS